MDPADVALPEGYRIEVLATGLTFPTDLAFDDETPEPGGEGSMLDHTTIVWTNELGKGNSHTLDNIPFVLVGGGLDFKMGRSLKLPKVAHNRLLMSLAHGFGHHIERFGDPALPDVAYHADDRKLRRSELERLSDSRLPGPEAPRELLVDDEHERGAFLVGHLEAAARLERDTHRLEVVGADLVQLHRRAAARRRGAAGDDAGAVVREVTSGSTAEPIRFAATDVVLHAALPLPTDRLAGLDRERTSLPRRAAAGARPTAAPRLCRLRAAVAPSPRRPSCSRAARPAAPSRSKSTPSAARAT